SPARPNEFVGGQSYREGAAISRYLGQVNVAGDTLSSQRVADLDTDDRGRLRLMTQGHGCYGIVLRTCGAPTNVNLPSTESCSEIFEYRLFEAAEGAVPVEAQANPGTIVG